MIIVLLLALLLCSFSFFYLIGDLQGAPFVPTKTSNILEILEFIRPKKGQLVYDLGCGDGRVLRLISKKFQIKGIGVEINPYLYLYAKLISNSYRNLEFIRGNLFNLDLSRADLIFVFLMPRTLNKLKDKITKECRKGTVIISHGFTISGWDKRTIKRFDRKGFSSYIYRV